MSTTNSAGKTVRFLLSSLAAMLIAILGLVLPSSVSGGSGAWSPTSGPLASAGMVNAIVVHPITPTTLYATVGVPTNGGMAKIYKSTNTAENWSPVYTGTTQLYALAVTGTLIYATGAQLYGENAIVKSENSGATWTAVFTGTNKNTGGSFNTIAINPVSTTTVYAAGTEWGSTCSEVVYRSGDGGATWQQVLNVPIPQGCPWGMSFWAMTINPTTPTTVYVAGGNGSSGSSAYGIIYKTTNDGANWTPVYSTTAISEFTSLAVDPNTLPATLYTGTGKQKPYTVYRGADDGTGWSQLISQAGEHLALDLPNNTFYASRGDQVYVSDLSGTSSWTIGSPLDQILSLAIDLTSNPRILYAGLYQQGVAKSSNGGATWVSKNTGIQAPIAARSIAVDPQNPNKLFAAADYQGGYRSADGGATWIPLSDVPYLESFAVNPGNPNIILAGGSTNHSSSILRSTNGGLNWTGVYTAPFILPSGSNAYEAIYALAVDPAVTTTAYAAGYDGFWPTNWGALLKNVNGGLDWTLLMTTTAGQPGTGQTGFRALAINPVTHTTVYAGGAEGSSGPYVGMIYRSINSGVGWTRIFTTTGGTIRSIVIDYQKPNVLYASDDSLNIYKSTNGGDAWVKVWDKVGRASGRFLAIDPHVPSHIYLAGSSGGYGFMGESGDGGLTFSQRQDPFNSGVPPMEAQTLSVDNGSVTQNLYAGLSGVWKYTRTAPAPGAANTVTVPTAPPPVITGNPMTITALVVDQYQNWVADGTPVTFFADQGSFQGSTASPGPRSPRATVNKTTTNGVASASLTAPAGTANVVIESGGRAVTLQVQFTSANVNLYLPLIRR